MQISQQIRMALYSVEGSEYKDGAPTDIKDCCEHCQEQKVSFEGDLADEIAKVK